MAGGKPVLAPFSCFDVAPGVFFPSLSQHRTLAFHGADFLVSGIWLLVKQHRFLFKLALPQAPSRIVTHTKKNTVRPDSTVGPGKAVSQWTLANRYSQGTFHQKPRTFHYGTFHHQGTFRQGTPPCDPAQPSMLVLTGRNNYGSTKREMCFG